MENITKIYPNGFIANKGIDFECEQGSVHALLGENGAGKTTLMKILFGFLEPDEGSIEVYGQKVSFKNSLDAIKHGVGMVHQHFMLVEQLTVAENVVLGREPKKNGLFDFEEAVRITGQVAQHYNFKLDPRVKVEDCSVGVKQKIEILKALLRGAKILILDEPTAVLTPQEVIELFEELKKLRDMGHTIVFISHKLNEVMAFCDSFTILRKGRVAQEGKIADYSEQELSNFMIGRVLSKTKKRQNKGERGEEILRVRDVSYTNRQGKKLLESISFSLCKGEIIGVAGVEGNGQNELSELITGLARFSQGDITVDGVSIKGKSVRQIRDMGISNISEDRMVFGCSATLSVIDNMIADRYYKQPYSNYQCLNTKVIKREVKELVGRYEISCPDEASAISMLSGGNIQKVIVAREFTGGAHVVVANQPTRGIDVGAASFIHDQLIQMTADNDAAVLLISADLSEILSMSDAIIVMVGGEISAYIEDASKVSELELGEYMLGVKKMDSSEIIKALHSAKTNGFKVVSE